jgi:sugar phosphate permease
MAGGAISTSRQLGYAFGIAVLGDVFRAGLQHSAGAGLASALSGGQAGAVVAHSPGLAHLVHQAFANGLDLTFLVAGGVGVVVGILVFALVRPRPAEAMTPHGQESVTIGA